MIHKFWNVRLSPAGQTWEPPPVDEDASEEERRQIREEEDIMEEKVFNIWNTLSTFEESSAACISDMLLHVSNGAYIDGVLVAKRFIGHVEILFGAVDQLAGYIKSHELKGESCAVSIVTFGLGLILLTKNSLMAAKPNYFAKKLSLSSLFYQKLKNLGYANLGLHKSFCLL